MKITFKIYYFHERPQLNPPYGSKTLISTNILCYYEFVISKINSFY